MREIIKFSSFLIKRTFLRTNKTNSDVAVDLTTISSIG